MDDICNMEKCEKFKTNGDLLFCFTHRHNWRGFCKLNGIEDIDIPQTETYLLLDLFCEKITEKEYYARWGYKISSPNSS